MSFVEMCVFTKKFVDSATVLGDDHLVPVAEGALKDWRRRIVVDVEKHGHVIICRLRYVWLKKIIQYKELNVITFTKTKSDNICLLYTSPSPRDRQKSRMPSSA